jgi:hypothetical protein
MMFDHGRPQLARVAMTMLMLTSAAPAQQPSTTTGSAPNWGTVEDALGRKGAPQPGGVIKFSFPRSDLTVTVGGVIMKPALALGGWLAFKETAKGQAMAMGDLVLTETEVGAVMRALQAGGIEPTALHNHLLHESPHVMYMHVSAHGDAMKIATVVHDALALSKTPLGPPAPPSAPSAAELDTAGIASALGVSGKLNGVVYQVSVPRKEKITSMGIEVPPSMGVSTAINFQPTGNGNAAITGDFVLRAAEVAAAARALRDLGIEVTAIHSHMVEEEPRLYFMHFWANANASTLAKGLRAALDETTKKH